MEVARTLNELHAARARLRGTVALVPTMGALHDGHATLIRRAAASADHAALSIFVNPLQFGPTEDLSRYPRTEEADLATAEAAGCRLAWLPDVTAMYPAGAVTTIELTGPAERWEGAARPGHFRGVATVCAKLFGQVRPQIAVFGEKDWQQLQVIQRMVADLHLPLSIDPAPTVREPDGLALSSRNRFLDPASRATAPILHDTLARTAHALRSIPAEIALAEGRALLAHHGFEVDYLALVDALTLEPLAAPRPPSRLIAAARLGGVRLIDNLPGPS